MSKIHRTKTWFSIVITKMKNEWSESLTWDQNILLCHKLTSVRDQYRKSNGVIVSEMLCSQCDTWHDAQLTEISVGSMFFALKKNMVITEDTYEMKMKEWYKYQRKNKLDKLGNTK